MNLGFVSKMDIGVKEKVCSSKTDMVTELPLYITDEHELQSVAHELEKKTEIAVDLEADSMFHFEERVCLIQIATDVACYIVDPLYISDLSSLKPVFADQSIVKIFHGADYDVRSMYRDFSITINNLFDTELASRFLGYSYTSLEAVLKRHFDITLDKKFQKKDWSVRPLPKEMIAYAADDVHYLVELYNELKAELQRLDRLDWAMENCGEISRVRAENGGEEQPLFLKVKGAGRLDPGSLAVLENLLQLRREIARKKDRPPFKILGNKTLLELADEKPKTPSRLFDSRKLSEKQYHMYGKAVAEAISEAVELPEDQLPKYPRKPKPHVSMAVTLRIKALKKWRDKKAEVLGIDPAMLVTKAAMKEMSEQFPRTVDALAEMDELKQWQIETFGREWVSLLEKTG